MARGRPKRISVSPPVKAGGPPPPAAHLGCSHGAAMLPSAVSVCPGCAVRGEMIEFLRDQIRQRDMQLSEMQNKLLALCGDASDRYHRLRMSEIAQRGLSSAQGIVPMEQIVEESDGDDVDAFMNAFGIKVNQ